MLTRMRFSRKYFVTCSNCSSVPFAPRRVMSANTSLQRSQDPGSFMNTAVVWHLPQTICTARQVRIGFGSFAEVCQQDDSNSPCQPISPKLRRARGKA